jgi:hypothetical protein
MSTDSMSQQTEQPAGDTGTDVEANALAAIAKFDPPAPEAAEAAPEPPPVEAAPAPE